MPGGAEIERLIALMAKLPGLGPRSARRAVLTLVRKKERLMAPLAAAMADAAEKIRPCSTCGNISASDICDVCRDAGRDRTRLCVVADVADLWAMERAAVFKGRYHVLGGVLSALDGIAPEDLGIPRLAQRVAEEGIVEVILALNVTIDGQTTAHVIADYLAETGAEVTSLARGVPVGGELDYLDDGTISAALTARKSL